MTTAERRLHIRNFLFSLLISFIAAAAGRAAVVTGHVASGKDSVSLAGVTVRVPGTSQTMLTNESGAYRLRLDPGKYQLRFSHVAHHSVVRDITIGAEDLSLDVFLPPALIEIPGTRVYTRAYDPAQRIIVEAIRRKKEILNRLGSYYFDAYTRLVVENASKPDSESIMLITESQMKGFWEKPDKYKEIITARKVSSNIDPEGTLVTIGEILNFNSNRIEIDQYSIVSPTATDALKYYNYYLIDTVYIDDKLIFRLELEPVNNNNPLFVGTIDIVDSTFEIVGVECGFSEGFDIPYIDSITYYQHFSRLADQYWMPTEIGFSAQFDLPIPGLPRFDADYVASLHNYSFEIVHQPGTFDYVLEVDANADDVDSAVWYSGQLIPLTPREQRAYDRIDSLKNIPKPAWRKILNLTLMAVTLASFEKNIFHFNRVEGAYLGISGSKRKLLPKTALSFKTGYAFSRKKWQHSYSARYRLWPRRLVDIGVTYTDDIVPMPSMMSEGYNPTLMSLFSKTDPLDYYHIRGVELNTDAKISKGVYLRLGYRDQRHYSESNHTNYGFFNRDSDHRPNPQVLDGAMRSGFARITFDSRPVARLKDEEVTYSDIPMTRVQFEVESASPDLIDNDFDFLTQTVRLQRRQRTLGAGVTTINLMLAASSRALPPQRYFNIDFGDDFFGNGINFKTLADENFKGNQAAFAYGWHDFGKRLFRRSGVPLIRSLPFSLAVYGGVFWTDFVNHTPMPGDEDIRVARKMYAEIGLSLGNIPPFGLQMLFTRQLSDYDTNDFVFSIGTDF